MGRVVLVCGGRDYDKESVVVETLNDLNEEYQIEHLVMGDATGADALAHQWARRHGIPSTVYRAHWEEYGKNAGPIRNQAMFDDAEPELVVAFPGGKGTQSMIQLAEDFGVAVMEIEE